MQYGHISRWAVEKTSETWIWPPTHVRVALSRARRKPVCAGMLFCRPQSRNSWNRCWSHLPHSILPTIHGMKGWLYYYDTTLNQCAKGISVSEHAITMAQSTLLPSTRVHNRIVCEGKGQVWCMHASQSPMQQYVLLEHKLVLIVPQHQTCSIVQRILVYMGLPLSSSITVIRSEWKEAYRSML